MDRLTKNDDLGGSFECLFGSWRGRTGQRDDLRTGQRDNLRWRGSQRRRERLRVDPVPR